MAVDLKAPELYSNRELSWLAFNRRVLSLAARQDVPLLERLKFVAITASNLNEFFMVRVGGLEHYRRQDEGFAQGPDGLSLPELLAEVWREGSKLCEDLSSHLYEGLLPELAEHGVRFISKDDVDDELRARAQTYYRTEVHPCLTPIAIDSVHPFPSLRNGSINLAVQVERTPDAAGPFERPVGPLMAIVQLPNLLPRFVSMATDDMPFQFMALEDVIALFVEELFSGYRVIDAIPFRVTRASDLDIDEDEAEDLLVEIKDGLRRRDLGAALRLEIDEQTSEAISERMRQAVHLEPHQVQRIRGLIDLSSLFSVLGRVNLPVLKDAPHIPAHDARLDYGPALFRAIRDEDILLHHPYESFRHVVDFIEQAADDPDVVAIKQTLYRTSGDSPVVSALKRAAEAGKEVTALIELKARFDEANNINWAQQLEESGAHVVYGLIGLKTHSKMMLVTRREGQTLQRYAHLATGNYNPKTANLYTDLGLLTADEDITHDVMLLFNVLTGYAELPKMRRLVVAPFNMRTHVLSCIDREIEHAQEGRPAGLRAKMNSLVDGQIIRALYRASQAGVRIELIVRGICCLRPQIPGVSDNIHVRSILDRFLEHARIFCWENGGEPEVFLSSADLMPRNLNKRIEVGFPIRSAELKKRILDDILPVEWSDNLFSWDLQADGVYVPRHPEQEDPLRAQATFIQMAHDDHDTPRTRRTSRRTDGVKPQRLSPAVRAAHAQQRRLR
ncbi:MAG: polyphosphate kinase 1 [Myxococcota bacterium]